LRFLRSGLLASVPLATVLSVAKTLFLSLLLAGAAEAARDPTLPPPSQLPAAAAEAAAPLRLQAILRTSQGAAQAVIDGQRLRVGEALGGARVLAIYPRSVLIERQGQRQQLRLAEPIVKPSR